MADATAVRVPRVINAGACSRNRILNRSPSALHLNVFRLIDFGFTPFKKLRARPLSARG